jgi:hypothetical protein
MAGRAPLIRHPEPSFFEGVRISSFNYFKKILKEIATSFIQRTVELLVMTVLDRYFHDSLVPFYGLRIFPFCLNYFSNRKIIAPIEMVNSII